MAGGKPGIRQQLIRASVVALGAVGLVALALHLNRDHLPSELFAPSLSWDGQEGISMPLSLSPPQLSSPVRYWQGKVSSLSSQAVLTDPRDFDVPHDGDQLYSIAWGSDVAKTLTPSTHTGSCELFGEQPLVYMDRQKIECTDANSAIHGFTFTRCSNNDFKNDAECLADPDLIGDEGPMQSTRCNDGAAYNSEYMDRHAVICPANSALSYWRLLPCDGNNVRVEFKCRSVPTLGYYTYQYGPSGCQQLRYSRLEYFDRQDATCPDNQVLTGFQVGQFGCGGNDMQTWLRCAEVMNRCEVPANPQYGSVERDPYGRAMPVGSTVQVSCSDGYELVDEDSSTLTCGDDGKFTPDPSACQQIMCTVPAAPEFGTLSEEPASKVAIGTKVELTCDEGWAPIANNPTEIECQRTGYFLQTFSICKEVFCPPLQKKKFTTISETKKVKPGVAIQVECESSKYLVSDDGGAEVTCQADGTYDLEPLECAPGEAFLVVTKDGEDKSRINMACAQWRDRKDSLSETEQKRYMAKCMAQDCSQSLEKTGGCRFVDKDGLCYYQHDAQMWCEEYQDSPLCNDGGADWAPDPLGTAASAYDSGWTPQTGVELSKGGTYDCSCLKHCGCSGSKCWCDGAESAEPVPAESAAVWYPWGVFMGHLDKVGQCACQCGGVLGA